MAHVHTLRLPYIQHEKNSPFPERDITVNFVSLAEGIYILCVFMLEAIAKGMQLNLLTHRRPGPQEQPCVVMLWRHRPVVLKMWGGHATSWKEETGIQSFSPAGSCHTAVFFLTGVENWKEEG